MKTIIQTLSILAILTVFTNLLIVLLNIYNITNVIMSNLHVDYKNGLVLTPLFSLKPGMLKVSIFIIFINCMLQNLLFGMWMKFFMPKINLVNISESVGRDKLGWGWQTLPVRATPGASMEWLSSPPALSQGKYFENCKDQVTVNWLYVLMITIP